MKKGYLLPGKLIEFPPGGQIWFREIAHKLPNKWIGGYAQRFSNENKKPLLIIDQNASVFAFNVYGKLYRGIVCLFEDKYVFFPNSFLELLNDYHE